MLLKLKTVRYAIYLPNKYKPNEIPLPADNSVKISSIEPGYFAVIRYSGFASDKNFYKHREVLKVS